MMKHSQFDARNLYIISITKLIVNFLLACVKLYMIFCHNDPRKRVVMDYRKNLRDVIKYKAYRTIPHIDICNLDGPSHWNKDWNDIYEKEEFQVDREN